MKSRLLLLILITFGVQHAISAVLPLALTLKNAEQQALETSARLRSMDRDVQAAIAQAQAQYTSLLPRLTLQGSYTYLSEVPSLTVGGGTSIKLGSNTNYSIGPALSYTLWDNDGVSNAYQASVLVSKSKTFDQENAHRQVIFSVRMAYVALKLAQEELDAVSHSLALSRAQETDISNRFSAGVAARMDVLLSNRQVVGYQLQVLQKQLAVKTAERTLLQLMGESPLDLPALRLDPLMDLLLAARALGFSSPELGHPQLQSLESLAQATERQTKSLQAKSGPTLLLSASSALNYPNGPIMEQINQNIVGASLTWPLFLGDPTGALVSQKTNEAQSIRERETQLREDLRLAYLSAQEAILSLSLQQRLSGQDLSLSEEISVLHYSAYKLGKVSFLDVQSANNQVLQSHISVARVMAQLISQYFMLSVLSGKENQS